MTKKILTTLAVMLVACSFTACGNADNSEAVTTPSVVADSTADNVTSTSFVDDDVGTTDDNAETDDNTSSDEVSDDVPTLTPPSEVVVTTTVSEDVPEETAITTAVPVVDVPEQTTTVATTAQTTTTTKKTTTTTKATTTTTKKTTTTTKATTTTKKTTTTTTAKVDDSKWAVTGILADYQAVLQERATPAQKQRVIDDMCNYCINKWSEKTGEITWVDAGAYDKDLFNEMNGDPTLTYDECIGKVNITKSFKLVVNKNFDFDNNAHMNSSTDTEYDKGDEYFPKYQTAEYKYKQAVMFRYRCWSIMDKGICRLNGCADGELGDLIDFYVSIDEYNDSYWGVWFLSG